MREINDYLDQARELIFKIDEATLAMEDMMQDLAYGRNE